jgi:PAS domain S-box-containing protein
MSPQSDGEKELQDRTIIDASPMGIMIFQLNEEGLQLADGNYTAESILRMDIKTQLGRKLENIFPDAPGFTGACRKVAVDGGVVHEDVTLSFLDYSSVFALTGFQTSPGQVFVTFLDITSQKQAEIALIESEDLFRTTFINATIGIAIADENTRFTSANDAFCKILGYIEKELKELTIRDITHPDDVLESAEKRNDLRAGRISKFSLEKRFIRKDGNVIFGRITVSAIRDQENKVRRFIVELEDITDRLESERKYRTIFEDSIEGIYQTTPEGKIITCNTAFAKMLGYDSPEEMVAEINDVSHQVYVNPEDRTWLIEQFTVQDNVENFEFQAYRRDGQRIWISANARVVRDNRGEPRYYEGNFIDITERKKSREQFELLKRSIDASKDPAYWLFPDGRFAYVNDAACTLAGYTREEMMEKTVWDVNMLMRDIPGRWESMWEQLREHGSYQAESINLTKDGKEIPVEIVSTYVRFGDQEYQCGFARDISERKKAEKVLRDSENLYKTTIDSIDHAIDVADKDLKILVVNREFMNVVDRFGFSQDVIGKTMREEFPFLPERVDDEYRQVFETGQPVITEEAFDLGGGHYVRETRKLPVFDGDEVTRVVTSVKDITEKKQAELALERQSKIENLLARISTKFINISPELVDQEIQSSLEQLCEALEIDRITVNSFNESLATFDRTLRGSRSGDRSSIDVYDGINLAQYSQKFADLQQGSFEKINDRNEQKENDPAFFHLMEQAGSLSALIAPLYARNKPYGIITFSMTGEYRDWTEEDERLLKMLGEILVNAIVYKEQAKKQRLAETLVAQELEKLKDLDRLRTEFIFRASHELKTPLSGVIGAVGLLKESASRFTPVEHELLDIINRGGDRLRILILRLVDSLRMEEESSNLVKKTVDLVPIISGVVDRLSFLSNLRNQELSLNLPHEIMENVDPAKIETVMENLITNAINNTPVGGQIEVSTRVEPDHVELVVRDTGVGFTEEEKANVFKKFGKIERYGQEMDVITEGSGLGLYISKRIIESHGGTITLESKGRDKGSTFVVNLPLPPENEQKSQE